MSDNALVPATAQPMAQARRMLAQPAVQRALPMLGIAGIVGAAALAWSAISAPPQRDLLGGLSDGDKAAVATALETASLPYTIDAATGAIRVAAGDYHKARMLLATQGLPKSAPSAASMLDSMPMGASHAVENERLKAARESDLARTIEAMDPVDRARVHIAAGNGSPFLRDDVAPSASVMLTLAAGRTLGAEQARAITHLVASSVGGLSPERVSLTDQAGKMLNGDADGAGGEASRQIDVQERIEDRYRQALATLLTPLVGADGFTAEVNAELEFAENQSTRETFPQEQRAVAREESRWTSSPGEAPAVGIPGALSNTPPPAAELATTPPAATQPGATPPGRTQQDLSRSYELGREVAVTKAATGTVKRLSVAVALRNPKDGKPRPAAEVAAIEALVRRAVGFDDKRGDQVVVSSRPFVEPAAAETGWMDAFDLPLIGRYLAAIAAVALVVFGIGRPFLKWRQRLEADRKAEAAALIEGELQAVGAGAPITLEMISAAPSYADRAALVRDFVQQDPKRAAAVVRTLLEPKASANG